MALKMIRDDMHHPLSPLHETNISGDRNNLEGNSDVVLHRGDLAIPSHLNDCCLSQQANL